jgi:RNA polymerase sigma-70 factor (ECF subfamily)
MPKNVTGLDDDRYGALLLASREGCHEAWSELLQVSRAYLLLVADEELDTELQAKLGASDVVQQTLLEAHLGFDDFRGHTQGEFLAWLRQILLHNLANCRRYYQFTDKRRTAREISLDLDGSLSGLNIELADDTTSPSDRASRKEEADRLDRALHKLPADYRQVIILRNREQRTFKEIGLLLNRSADAARMLWYRAFEGLVSIMEKTSTRESHSQTQPIEHDGQPSTANRREPL